MLDVYVDGQNVGSGNQWQPLPGDATAPQQIFAHYGLDGREHSVTVKKNDPTDTGSYLAFNCASALQGRALTWQTSS